MSTEKHTPLPWEIEETADGIETTGCGFIKAAYRRDNKAMREEAFANAELIVTAVNNHDRLLAENKRIEAEKVMLGAVLNETIEASFNIMGLLPSCDAKTNYRAILKQAIKACESEE